MEQGSSPVINLIVKRALDGSKPGQRGDGHKLGLAIEGGAMRGVVTAGMVTGLEMLGLRDSFDAVYGSSGGASNGAYFVAGQAAYGTTIYYYHINSRDFIDFWRPFRNKAIVDFRFVTDQVMAESVILDWKEIIESPIPLKVLASSVENGDVELLENFQSHQELLQALHASARIPLVSGRSPFKYKGRLFWDPGILDPFAIKSALTDKCSHVLVLRSRPRGLPRRRISFLERTLIVRNISKWNESLARRYPLRYDPEHNGVAQLEKSQECPNAQPYLFGITVPPNAPNLSRWEKRRNRLVSGAAAGVEAVLSTFGVAVSQVSESLTAMDQHGHAVIPTHLDTLDRNRRTR